MDAYEYTPLEQGYIRLLKILPGEDSEPVSCKLVTVSLTEEPEYAALSYTWGIGAADQIISINGRRLMVGRNLEDALREFRARPAWIIPAKEPATASYIIKGLSILLAEYPSPDASADLKQLYSSIDEASELMKLLAEAKVSTKKGRVLRAELGELSSRLDSAWEAMALKNGTRKLRCHTYYLWIDAISINQADLAERSEQIKRMGDIYKNSMLLIVWLGAESENSNEALSILQTFERNQMDSEQYVDEKVQKINSPEEQLAISKLFCRPWFKRAWVVQEYALGGRGLRSLRGLIVFCCGQQRMQSLTSIGFAVLGHKKFAMSIDETSALRNNIWQNVSPHEMLRGMMSLKDRYQARYDRMTYQLLVLMWQCRSALSADPRDKIYAFLGLAMEIFGECNDFSSQHLIMDYAAPVEDVYSSFVRAVVEATTRLEILCLCNRESPISKKRTWTVDWSFALNESMSTDMVTVGSVNDDRLMFTYNATPGTTATFEFSPDWKSMIVSGFVVCEITGISSVIELGAEEHLRHECFEILQQARLTLVCDQEDQEAIIISRLCKALTWSLSYERKGGSLRPSWIDDLRRWIDTRDDEFSPLRRLVNSIRDVATFVWSLIGITRSIASYSRGELVRSHELPARDVHVQPSTDYSPHQSASINTAKEVQLSFMETLRSKMDGMDRIFVTRGGHIGRCKHFARLGDFICLLEGCVLPMILRKVDTHYELIGDAYADGIMQGEAMTLLESGERMLQAFELH